MKCEKCQGADCICALKEERDKLALACQIFTGAFEKGGYIPNLGSLRTNRAIALMKEAGVRPVHYWEWLHQGNVTQEIK